MKSRWNSTEPAQMLGATVSQQWRPTDLCYYERQWNSQRGAWGDPDIPARLQEDVSAVINAFKTRGTAAGMEMARRRGLGLAAKVYVDARAENEEELAARLASIRARLATNPTMTDELRQVFVQARLDEVREAGAHTPPQAVADKPDVARKGLPRWMSYAAIGMSAVALVRSFGGGR